MGHFLARAKGGTGMVAAALVVVALILGAFWVRSTRTGPEEASAVVMNAPATSGTAGETSEGATAAVATPDADQPAAQSGQQVAALPAENEPATQDAAESASDTPVAPVEGSSADQTVAEAPATDTAAGPDEVAQAATTPAPSFDEVRRETDGMTVIAGRGAPGARIEVLQDGSVLAETIADGSGRFAVIAMLPADGAAHVLSLSQTAEGETQLSDGEIILAPVAAPVQTAEATETDTSDTPVVQQIAALPEQPGAPVAAGQTVDSGTASAGGDDSARATGASETAGVTDSTTTAQAGAEGTTTASGLASTSSETGSSSDTATLAAQGGADTDAPTATTSDTAQTTQTAHADATASPNGATPSSETTQTVAQSDSQTGAQSTAADSSGDPATGQEVATDDQGAMTGTQTTASATTAAPVAQASAAPAENPASTDPQTTAPPAATPQATAQVAPQVTLPTASAAEPDQAPQPQPETVAVLKSTAEGVELLNTPAPEVMDNVAIDTISYSDTGAVQLSGRAQTAAKNVRVYLDNASVIDLPVDKQGRWRGDLPNVDEGIYTLRVDEVAADGAVTSRIETPFKREAPATLAAAMEEQTGPISAITVQKGATLWAIARDRYGDGLLYVRVFEANRDSIRDPDLIYPGQVFALPE